MSDVAKLNSVSHSEAHEALLRCCGSDKWARRMIDERPFQNLSQMLLTADDVWWSLDAGDWLEAFSAHPKIGETKPAGKSESAQWAAEEQSGVSRAANETLNALRKANKDYEKKYGYIFIVCATGKSAEEMLALLNERMKNDSFTELRMAADEQRRITHLRIEKLLAV